MQDSSKVMVLNKETIHHVYSNGEYEHLLFDAIVLITHPGVFHADDVCSAALLNIALRMPGWQQSAQIYTTRVNADCQQSYENVAREIAGATGKFIGVIIFDIGLSDFDHHQGIEMRTDDSDIPYAAFGKLWRELGATLVGEESATIFEDMLVKPIDAGDNGIAMNPLSGLISAFNPNWNESQYNGARDIAFDEAVDAVQRLFMKWFNRAKSAGEAKNFVRGEYNTRKATGRDTRVLSLSQFAPAGRLFVDEFPEVVYTVYPSARGGYSLSAVSATPGKFDNKLKLPGNWLINPPPGCTFVHNDRFMAVFSEEALAVHAAESWLREYDVAIDSGAYVPKEGEIWFSYKYRRVYND